MVGSQLVKKKRVSWEYNISQMEAAYSAVKNGSSLSSASMEFGVPKSTLHEKVKELSLLTCRKGPSTVLSKIEEERLEMWILNKAKIGFPMHEDTVRDAVQKILIEEKRANPFSDSRPGHKWVKLFLNRHPEIKKIQKYYQKLVQQ